MISFTALLTFLGVFYAAVATILLVAFMRDRDPPPFWVALGALLWPLCVLTME